MLFLTRRREGAKARRGLIFTHAKTRRREEEKTKTINGGMSCRCASIHAAGRKARKGALYRGRIGRIRRIRRIGPTTKDDDERRRRKTTTKECGPSAPRVLATCPRAATVVYFGLSGTAGRFWRSRCRLLPSENDYQERIFLVKGLFCSTRSKRCIMLNVSQSARRHFFVVCRMT